MTHQKNFQIQAHQGKTKSAIYTRKGDFGTTALRAGERISKSHQRIHVLGTVDELNCWLGFVRSNALDKKVEATLAEIQQHLFIIQAMIACPEDTGPILTQRQVSWLEEKCDTLDAQVPKLTHFVIPGGSPAGAALHLSRTVCRRAERTLVALHDQEVVEPILLKYLNRLSDLLFILARFENQQAKFTEAAPRY